ncbi:MAG TPA: HNH endonuclease [Kofleriaceae bacterium]
MRAYDAAFPASGSVDPALEATLLGILAQRVPAGDVAAEHARVRSLTIALGAVPDEARGALLVRLSRVGAHDALAYAFASRLHHATRARLLAVLRGDAVPLPSPRDALSDEGFAAHVTGFEITPTPLVLHRRFAPSVTAMIQVAGLYGPTADVDPVTVTVRALDSDGDEVGSERALWPEAEPRSDAVAITLVSADQYTLAADVTRGGLLIAQQRDEIDVVELTSDVAAAASLSAPQRQIAVDRLATEAATETDPAARTRIEDDRNVFEYLAARAPALPPPTPRPNPPDLVRLFDEERALDVSADPVFLQDWIERTYREDGMAAVEGLPSQIESVASGTITFDAQNQPDYTTATFATTVVEPLLVAAIAQFHVEVDEFQERFETTATRIAFDLLNEGETSARAELARYGVVATKHEHTQAVNGARIDAERTYTTTEVSGGDTEDADAMTAAAATLAENQRVIDRMHARITGLGDVQAARASGPLGAGAGAGSLHLDEVAPELLATAPTPEQLPRVLEALQRLTATAELAHDAQIAALTTEYPLLASYLHDADGHTAVDADALDRLKGLGVAYAIYDRIGPVLENVAKVREAIGGRFNVWKEPRIVQLAMTELLVAPGTLRGAMIDARVASESEGSWTDWALAVVTFGLALLSAIPTGGSSLVAGIAATAAVADASIGAYMLADHVAQYGVDLAAAHTDLDEARALSATEPSLFWLAVDIVGTGVGMTQAAHAFGRIAGELAKARRAVAAGVLTAAQLDEGSAAIHVLAREGSVTAEGAERAEAELRAIAGDAPAALATDARIRVSAEHAEDLARRLGVPVEIDTTGRLKSGVELHYARAPNGDIRPLRIIAGSAALVDDVLVHAAVIRRITRYNGTLGELRRLWDRLVVLFDGRPGVPRAGAAWESYQELAKLDDLIALRQAAKFGGGVIDGAALDEEITFFESMRARHAGVIAEAERSGELGEAAGHIDAPDWRDAMGRDDPSVRGMHEIDDPLGDVPERSRLPVAKPIDPAVPPEQANSGFWEDDNARGNSRWYSDNEAVNRITGGAPIEFRNGYPVLDPYVIDTVRLAKMTGQDAADFAEADAEMARRAGVFKRDGTPNAEWFAKQRRAKKLTWHHNQDGATMQLLPTDLHANIPHIGGASGARSKP